MRFQLLQTTMYKHLACLFTMLLFLQNTSFATHLKGGEITVRRKSTNSKTFIFKLTTYTENNQANVAQEEVTFCFGDNSDPAKAKRKNGGGNGVPIPNSDGTFENIYEIEHTYASAALSVTVSVAINNRNANILNFPNSSNISFYVETQFSLSDVLLNNSTPLLMNPAIDITAVIGQKFIHNPNAIDPEGDSLSYELISCKLGIDGECTRGTLIPNFEQPNQVSNIPSSFTMNSLTGDLVWDAPQQVGSYNCAFVVIEWRKGALPGSRAVEISRTTRDMQINVKDALNKAPKIKVPDEICVEAGTLIRGIVSATDVDGDRLTITSTGAVYGNIPDNPFTAPFASFSTTANTPSPTSGTFTWQTSCNHIRPQSYDIFFKVKDTKSATIPSLVDSKIWKIKVVAPSIKNLTAKENALERTTTLTWSKYACEITGLKIAIYRSNTACNNSGNEPCTTGAPAGYTKIAEVLASETSYKDTKLQANANYNYVAIAQFSNGTQSVASNNVCVLLSTPVPLITNVSVTKTNDKNGEIFVRWTRPNNLDTSIYKGPYQYRIFKKTVTKDGTYNQIFSTPADLSGLKNDTTFTDKGINTEDIIHYYKIVFDYTTNSKNFAVLDSSDASGSVFSSAKSTLNNIELTWESNTAWSNSNQTHRIYRETFQGSGIYNRIADVAVKNTFTYKDDGTDKYSADGTNNVNMTPDSTYCYVVETVGSYNNSKIKTGLLYNFSQKICGSAKSDITPCPPILTLSPINCDLERKKANYCFQNEFVHDLKWTNPEKVNNQICDSRFALYNIYFSKEPNGTFTKIGQTRHSITNFQNTLKETNIGCYYVTAINTFGNESAPSNIVCADNCPNYDLPNVFTPNNDKRNDIFTPITCPRFIKSVLFKVYDRYGQKVYETTEPLINWNGENESGKGVNIGTYLYSCTIVEDVLDKSKATKKLKGWIEVLK